MSTPPPDPPSQHRQVLCSAEFCSSGTYPRVRGVAAPRRDVSVAVRMASDASRLDCREPLARPHENVGPIGRSTRNVMRWSSVSVVCAPVKAGFWCRRTGCRENRAAAVRQLTGHRLPRHPCQRRGICDGAHLRRALHQLCTPVLDRLDQLQPTQRAALGTALGLSISLSNDSPRLCTEIGRKSIGMTAYIPVEGGRRSTRVAATPGISASSGRCGSQDHSDLRGNQRDPAPGHQP
jgi:hypothetical protein